MSYLDPKEQVLDLQLTPYGKLLLSIGELEPVFYAFFDDDIIYNGSNANIDNETQSAIEPRIQEETPRFSAQANTDSIETDFAAKKDAAEMIVTQGGQFEVGFSESEIFNFHRRGPDPMKKRLRDQPIGKYKNTDGFAPAWNAAFLKTPLSSSTNHLTISGLKGESTYNIPQLNVNIEYKAQRLSKAFIQKFTPEIIPQEYDPTQLGKTALKLELDNSIDDLKYTNGDCIFVTKDRLIIRLEESHTNFEKDNFEIELFEVTEDPLTGEERLKKAKFYKDFTTYTEHVLKDQLVGNAAENYFNLSVDQEIDPEIICPLIGKDKTKQFYIKKMFDCENLVEEGPVSNIYLDVDDSEDICE